MKRKIRIIFVSMVALVILCLSACSKVEFKVNFVVDGEIYATVNTNGNEVIKVPQNPTKEGYSFDGWYWDDSVWQKPFTANSLLDVPLSSDMNVYAKWEEINDNPPLALEGNSADISSIALTIEGDKAALVVSNTTETFSFLNDITVAPNASYVLAKDIGCESLIASKTVALAEGDNTYYILVTNGDTQKLYTVTIRRRPVYTVIFNSNNGTSVPSQHIEEGNFATIPQTTREGYKFSAWDYDFSNPITQEITINASWIPNSDTAYKVEYYIEKSGQSGYELYDTITYNGTTDSIISATLIPIEGFTYKAGNENKPIKGDGSLVFKVYYDRNIYSIIKGISLHGDITTTHGDYKYGESIEVTATPHLGYKIKAWYVNDILISESSSCIFEVKNDATVSVIYETLKEMSNFEFVSNYDTCIISGINDTTITEIIVPNYVTQIEYSAFVNCSNVVSISLPFIGTTKGCTDNSHIGYIFGASSYSDNIDYVPSSLKTIIITNDTSIADYAFYGCTGLTNLAIPASVTSIGTNAFRGCSNLEYTEYNNGRYLGNSENPYVVLVDIVDKSTTSFMISNLTKVIYNSAFNGCTELVGITIPQGVVSIGGSAFQNCTQLTSVIIPTSVTSIATKAFLGCTKLTNINIPSSITSIERQVFYGCMSLTSITIPSSVTSIDVMAFEKCTKLTSITIPSELTNIGAFAFYECTELVTINYCGTSLQWSAISKGEFWDYDTGSYTITYNYSDN